MTEKREEKEKQNEIEEEPVADIPLRRAGIGVGGGSWIVMYLWFFVKHGILHFWDEWDERMRKRKRKRKRS